MGYDRIEELSTLQTIPTRSAAKNQNMASIFVGNAWFTFQAANAFRTLTTAEVSILRNISA